MAVWMLAEGGGRGRVRCSWRGVFASEDGLVLWDRFARLKPSRGATTTGSPRNRKDKRWQQSNGGPDPGISEMRIRCDSDIYFEIYASM